MRDFGFHPEARQEFLESARYYKSQQPGLDRRFVNAVIDAIYRIRNNPLMYREIEVGCRQCRVPRFPYGVIFRLRNDYIEIIAVMHLHRKPGYWKGRK